MTEKKRQRLFELLAGLCASKDPELARMALHARRILRWANEPPNYVAVFLDAASRERLAQLVLVRHANVSMDHVTLYYEPKGSFLGEVVLPVVGRGVSFCAVAIAHDEKGQAVLVSGPVVDDAENRLPHVTISCAEGVEPVYSIDLLRNGRLEYFDEPIELSGVVDTFPSTLKGETDGDQHGQ